MGASWGKSSGQSGYDSNCDLDRNGTVDTSDRLMLAGNWGQ